MGLFDSNSTHKRKRRSYSKVNPKWESNAKHHVQIWHPKIMKPSPSLTLTLLSGLHLFQYYLPELIHPPKICNSDACRAEQVKILCLARVDDWMSTSGVIAPVEKSTQCAIRPSL